MKRSFTSLILLAAGLSLAGCVDDYGGGYGGVYSAGNYPYGYYDGYRGDGYYRGNGYYRGGRAYRDGGYRPVPRAYRGDGRRDERWNGYRGDNRRGDDRPAATIRDRETPRGNWNPRTFGWQNGNRDGAVSGRDRGRPGRR